MWDLVPTITTNSRHFQFGVNCALVDSASGLDYLCMGLDKLLLFNSADHPFLGHKHDVRHVMCCREWYTPKH